MKRGHLLKALFCGIIVCTVLGPVASWAAALQPLPVDVYFYPTALKRGDVLSDGRDGQALRVESDTLFLWVDLMPDADFAHPTKYIMIRDDERKPVLAVDGQWWPFLNGRPIDSSSFARGAPVSPWRLGGIKAYWHAVELRPGDVLSDGDVGRVFPIQAETFLFWVDLHPESRFEHPTRYVLISAMPQMPVIVADGDWWPLLNGERVLYQNPYHSAFLGPWRLVYVD